MKTFLDIWLHFGAFAYGIEGELVETKEHTLTFIISETQQSPKQKDIVQWLVALNNCNQSLVHCEIRVFDPHDTSKKLIFFSNQLPQLSPINSNHLIVSNLKPQNPDDVHVLRTFPAGSSPPSQAPLVGDEV